jgi:hypothetical protein
MNLVQRAFTLIALALVTAAIGHAQSGAQGQSGLTGRWEGATAAGSTIVLDLTVVKEALTGTLTRNGEPLPIVDGKVSKNTFTFKATLDEQPEGFTGELVGDDIKIWLDRQGAERAIVFKRVKK